MSAAMLGDLKLALCLAALLDTSAQGPLDVTLRCKDERSKSFRFHRRFDSYVQSIFVIADELPRRPVKACG